MAPKTRSQTIAIRRRERPDLKSDATYLLHLALETGRKSNRLRYAIGYTKICFHCKYAFKRERYPRRRPIPMDMFEECELGFVPSILKLVSIKTGKHQKEVQKGSRVSDGVGAWFGREDKAVKGVKRYARKEMLVLF